MSKRNNNNQSNKDMTAKNKINLRPLWLLGALILASAAVYASYRVLISTFNPEIVMLIYMTLATALALAYVIYNRGFSRKNITADMLPESWSEEKKNAFIEDGKLRLKKSKPLLVVVIAFFFTFVIEAIELFALPFFSDLLGL